MMKTKMTVRKPLIWLDEIELQQCPVCGGNNARVEYETEDCEIAGVGTIKLPIPKKVTCVNCGLSANIEQWNDIKYTKESK